MKPSKRAFVFVPVLVAALAASAVAGTVDEHRLSLDWQAATADVVAIGEIAGRVLAEKELGFHRATVRISERLKGPEDLAATVTVVWTGEAGPSIEDGVRALFFLSTVPDERRPVGFEGPLFRLVTGPFSAVKAGPVEVAFVKNRIALLTLPAGLPAVRMHLLEGMAAGSRLVVFSAALEFSTVLGISDTEVQVVVDAFRKQRKPDRTKRVLAAALGATKSRKAIAPLAEYVLAGNARSLRGTIGDALARIGDKAAVAALEPGMKSTRATTRADVVNILGRMRLATGSAIVVKALGDTAGEVRVEAGLAVGELARSLRARKQDAPDAAQALAAALSKAVDVREKKAILWAAAQLDTQAGYDIVRKVATDDTDRVIRDFARRTLKNPRKALVL
jgi:hypothetical protein